MKNCMFATVIKKIKLPNFPNKRSLMFGILLVMNFFVGFQANAASNSCVDACDSARGICWAGCDQSGRYGSGCVTACYEQASACRSACPSSIEKNLEVEVSKTFSESTDCWARHRACEESAYSAYNSCRSSCTEGTCLRDCAVSMESNRSICSQEVNRCLKDE